MDGLENVARGLGDGLDKLDRADLHGLRQAGRQAAALDLLNADLGARDEAGDADLEFLGRALADEDVVLAAHVAHDRLVKGVAGGLDRLALDHAAERHDRDLRRAAADVDDQMAVRLRKISARTGRRRHGGLDQIHLARAGLDDGIDDVALLHAGHAARHSDKHARLEEAERRHAREQLLEHERRHVIVRDDARADRMDGHDVRRCAAEHLLRVLTDLEHAAGVLVDRHDGRLTQHDALAAHEHADVGRAEVDGNVPFKNHHKAKLPYHPRCGCYS